MTMNLPLSQSPKTQFALPTPDVDEDELFAQGFRDLAYKALQKTLPELIANVISFKILETKASEAKGIGSFIVKNDEDIVFIPCIVSNNAIKPMDMFYSRMADRFYPLNIEWLRYSKRDILPQMGQAVLPPKTLQTDVDIRNLIVPPTTGRYSYASLFPEFMKKAPTTIKLAAKEFFRKNSGLFKLVASTYGAKELKDCLSIKKAELRKEHTQKHDLYMFTPKSSIEDLQEKLGPKAGEAYKALRYNGFYAHDLRKDLNEVSATPEFDSNLVQPDKSGLYTICLNNGECKKALIVVNPQLVDHNRDDQENMTYGVYSKDPRNKPKDLKPGAKYNYLVITEDGEATCTYDIIAEPLITASFDEITDFIRNKVKDAPSNGEPGCFISTDRLTVKATEPFTANDVSDNKGVIRCMGPCGDVVLNKHTKGNGIFKPSGESMIMLSNEFKWLPLPKRLDQVTLVKNEQTIKRLLDEKMLAKSTAKVACRKFADNEFGIPGEQYGLPVIAAVEKLAKHYHISVPDAIKIIDDRLHNKNTNFYITKKADDNTTLSILQQKMQELEAQKQTVEDLANRIQAQQAPEQMQGQMDPSQMQQMQGDPSQMQGQMAPSQMQMDPSQMQQMQMDPSQMQGQMDPSQMQMDPSQMQQMQMDPSQMQGDPSQMQGQMDPSQMQMDPSQMDPSQMQMDPSQMQQMQGDPSQMQQQQPPPPMIYGDVSPEALASQINPAFLQDAADLNEQDIFDAAMIGSMAKQPGITDLMQNYMPTLEKALDNLARLLLLLQVKENDVKERAGNQIFNDTEFKLRNTFKSMGETLLEISKLSEQEQAVLRMF